MAVDLQGMSNKIDAYQFEYQGHTEEDAVQFRTYKRKDFHKACGCRDTKALSNKLPELYRHHFEKTGEEIVLGFQPTPNGQYEYTLEEVYQLIELAQDYDSTLTKRSPLKIQRKYRRKRAQIISVANQKGGAGKSTTGIHIATAQATMNFDQARILLIDWDPQGNQHKFVEGTYLSLIDTKTVCRYLMNEYIDEHEHPEDDVTLDESRKAFIENELIRPTHIPNMDYCVALTKDNAIEGHLAQLEFNAMDDSDINSFNEDALGSNVYHLFKEKFIDLVAEDYDMIIIDSAPHNNTFIKMMLYTVDHLIIPAPTKKMDFESTCNFIKSTSDAFKEFAEYDDHPGLQQLTILPTMYSNTETARQLQIAYTNLFGNHVFSQPISQKTPLYEQMSQESTTIYSYSSDMTPTMKEVLNEWDKFNNHVRVCASQPEEMAAL